MKINDLRNSIKQNNISDLYLIKGNDRHLIDLAVNELNTKLSCVMLPELNITNIKENFTYNRFLTDINTMPFGSEKRLITVYFSSLTNETAGQLLDSFPEMNDFCIVVFVDDVSQDKTDASLKTPVYNKLINKLKNASVVDCSSSGTIDVLDYIISFAAKYKIKMSRGVANYFIEFVNTDTQTAINELNKLINIADNEITKEDIDKYCIKNDEYKIFQLNDYLAVGLLDKAKVLFDELLKDNANPVWIISMISKNLSKILAARLCLDAGYNYFKIKEVLKNNYEVKYDNQANSIIKQAEKYSSDQIRKGIISLYDADFKSKHGEFNCSTDLFGFLVNLYI